MGRIFSLKPSEFEIENVGIIRAGEAYAESHGGDLPETRFWRRLESRHDLDPARFGRWHPNLTLMLDHANNHVLCQDAPKDWTGCTRGPVDPPVLNHQTVPEPASAVMGVACIAMWCVAAWALGKRDSRK